MKPTIHPQYYPKAKVKCVCGHEWTVGSTSSEINTSICSKCHPFYTGTEKIVHTRGRVDRFKKQLEKTASAKKLVVTKKSRVTKNSKRK